MISRGEKYKKEQDFSVGNLYGFGLERIYRSVFATGALFGPYWLSTLDPDRLIPSDYFSDSIWLAIAASNGDVAETERHQGRLPYAGHSFDDRVAAPAGGDKAPDAKAGPDGATPEPSTVAVPNQFFYASADSGSLVYTRVKGYPGDEQGCSLHEAGKTSSFSSGFLLRHVSDYAGYTRTYSYVPIGSAQKLDSIANGAGQTVHFKYGDNGLVAQVVDPDNNTWRYEYAYTFKNIGGELKLAAVERSGAADCAAAKVTTAYDSNGHVARTVDFAGNATAYSYRPEGSCSTRQRHRERRMR